MVRYSSIVLGRKIGIFVCIKLRGCLNSRYVLIISLSFIYLDLAALVNFPPTQLGSTSLKVFHAYMLPASFFRTGLHSWGVELRMHCNKTDGNRLARGRCGVIGCVTRGAECI